MGSGSSFLLAGGVTLVPSSAESPSGGELLSGWSTSGRGASETAVSATDVSTGGDWLLEVSGNR